MARDNYRNNPYYYGDDPLKKQHTSNLFLNILPHYRSGYCHDGILYPRELRDKVIKASKNIEVIEK